MFKKLLSLTLCTVLSVSAIATAPTSPVFAQEQYELQYELQEVDSSVTSVSAAEDIAQAMEIILANYIDENVDVEQLRNAALKGMLSSLDPYSEFFTVEEFEQFVNDLNGRFVGIGIQVNAIEDGYTKIVSVFENSPAKAAGIKINDIIYKVDGVDIKDMSLDEVVSRIKGDEGTTVNITVKRGSKDITVDVYRKTIEIESVTTAKIADIVPDISTSAAINDQIGYIKISTFANNTYTEFKRAYSKLVENATPYLILDLRDNPGGYLDSVIAIARLLVPSGEIATLVEKSGPSTTYVSLLEDLPFKKIAVLINGNSASASEVLAGAIKDSKAGVLIGETTYGKGVVQNTFTLNNIGMIKFTTVEYVTRNGISINGVGIKPNYSVKQNAEVDNVIKRAYNYFVGIDSASK